MWARRFLGIIIILTLLVVAAGFAIFQWGGDVLLKEAVPKGHFEPRRAGLSTDLQRAGSRARAPKLIRRFGGRPASARRRRSVRRSSTFTRRPIFRTTAGMRRSNRAATRKCARGSSFRASQAPSTESPGSGL